MQLDALIRTALNNCCGIHGLMQRLDNAMCGVYQPKNYTEEKLRGLVFLRLGGSGVAKLVHQLLGTPGVSTLRHCSALPTLQTLSTTPSLVNLQHNLQLLNLKFPCVPLPQAMH